MMTDEEFLANNRRVIEEFRAAAARNPLFGQYEQTAERVFPVVVLDGVPAPA